MLAACGEPASDASEAHKPFRVVTTFTVIQDIAQNVAGDKAIVESITKPEMAVTVTVAVPSPVTVRPGTLVGTSMSTSEANV